MPKACHSEIAAYARRMKREEEADDIAAFLDVYPRATGEALEWVGGDEFPDAICERPDGPQCPPIQQIISGCPNPFMPHQPQCGGLMALLNQCPSGAYNPNNPSNPYNHPQPTCRLTVSPTNVSAAGQAATLTWQSEYAQYPSLSNSGQISPNGSMTVYPQGATTYTMTVMGYGNQQGQCQAQVTIGNQGGAAQPTAQISCQPQTADIGMQVGISFAYQNASAATPRHIRFVAMLHPLPYRHVVRCV